MDKDKILDYVRKTPANTNPNVLKTMLDSSGSGGGGTALVVREDHQDEGTIYYDKTWQEVDDALKNGQIVVFVHSKPSHRYMSLVVETEEGYFVKTSDGKEYDADSADGYLYRENVD